MSEIGDPAIGLGHNLGVPGDHRLGIIRGFRFRIHNCLQPQYTPAGKAGQREEPDRNMVDRKIRPRPNLGVPGDHRLGIIRGFRFRIHNCLQPQYTPAGKAGQREEPDRNMVDRKIRPRPGQIVAVVFLDHVQDWGAAVEMTAYGRLLSIDRLSLTILSWTQADPKLGQDPADPNNVSFTILRSTVKSLQVLEPRTSLRLRALA